MQITDRVKNCNGCEACTIVCKYACIKTGRDEDGCKRPVIDESGCNKCNSCVLYCPIFNPVELPEFEEFYNYKEDCYERDMGPIYRQTMRSLRMGNSTEFVGTLCQIAGLKSLLGDQLSHNLKLFPVYCDPEKPKRSSCRQCPFYQ